jgi:surfeit locus 1 family protein
VRDWPAPNTGESTNYGYMLQWWGMAVAALGFGLYAARRAARPDPDDPDGKRNRARRIVP